MSDEEITYSTVRFGKSSTLQNRGRPEETQGPRGTVHKGKCFKHLNSCEFYAFLGSSTWTVSAPPVLFEGCAFDLVEVGEEGHVPVIQLLLECLAPWYLFAIALGILCSLLVAVAVLVAYVSQYSGNKHELQKTLNSLTQQYHTLQSDNTLMKEMLTNKSRELDERQKELDSSNREQNRCCRETKVSDCIHFTGKDVEGYWLCSGIKCYFIMDYKDWSGCKQTCQDCSLSLLKIDDEHELKLLQVKVNPRIYWIGLSYDKRKSKWQWIDEEPSNLDSKITYFNHKTGSCAFLSRTRLDDTNCENRYHCICEMRMDKCSDSPSSKRILSSVKMERCAGRG
ncbi:killer cell lectin-like receptor 5 [Arvicola amphibius]|uniref:killer cell lectin-like receptor 5 n=1 Tax=Arvicola amphibius TaxID=1047088 RepID=UPI001C0977A3|nr:killer cell lectin-like receptor 5 [Arvicola amphibius]